MATQTDRPVGAGHNTARLTELFRTMVRIRAFEQTAMEAHKAGDMPGPLHVSIGQEGVAAGICINLRDDDRLTSNHRGHGHALAKGLLELSVLVHRREDIHHYSCRYEILPTHAATVSRANRCGCCSHCFL